MSVLTVGLGTRSYDIEILPDAHKRVAAVIAAACPKARRILVVTDSNVTKLYAREMMYYLEQGGYSPHLFACPAGEGSKSIAYLERAYNALTDAKLTRTDCIVALGGGVVGDLAGFAAASYLRGIAFVQVPTTLLAMVDSSVGGKTGINLAAGKNLVGAFWQPCSVLVNLPYLHTLTDRDFFSGMAEVIKYAYIADADGALYDILLSCRGERKALMERMEEIVYLCCQIKAEVVEQDEREGGRRMILNFGHTLGHAYEKAGGYKRYTHGEAVSAGMVAAAKLGAHLSMNAPELIEDVRTMVTMHHLPEWIACTQQEYTAAIGLDKKGQGDSIHFVFVPKRGDAEPKTITKTALFDAITECGL